MKKILLACFFISIGVFGQKPDARLAKIDLEINKVLKDQKAAGAAVAVVLKDKVIFAQGFGYRDIEKKLPVTVNTQFAIGSCTKAFTCALLGILQNDGKLEFDKPVTTYLSDVKFSENQLTEQVTLRDMMCHRTGLPRHDYSWYLSPDSRSELVKRIAYLKPSAPLRQRWQYNNFMFMLQGVVAEKLTGKSWEANVKEKIFAPLAFTHSNFSVKDMAQYQEPAIGHGLYNENIQKLDYYNIEGMGPAGSINSTVIDMAEWVKLWINGGKKDNTQVLPASYIKEAISSQMIIGGGLPTKEKPDVSFLNYGFGWFLANYKGHYWVEHGGNIDGFSASTCFFPTDSLGIVVLTNQNGSDVPGVIRNLIVDRMLGIKYFDWNADNLKTKEKAKKAGQESQKLGSSNRKSNTKLSHTQAEMAGIYSNNGYGKFEVSVKSDSLFAQFKEQKYWIRQVHYDIFEIFDTKPQIDTTDKSPVRFQFDTGLDGNIKSISIYGIEPTLSEPVIFNRSEKTPELSKKDLEKYVGEYELAGTVVKAYIKNEKTLYVFVPGQPEYELVPNGLHKFDLKILSGYSVLFEVNDKNAATALTFQQPNGNFKAERK
jgi:CubicO group peptidase (beta-lactamase class C family)